MLRLEGADAVDAFDPVVDRAGARAAQGVEVRERPVKIVAGNDGVFGWDPDEERVVGFAVGFVELYGEVAERQLFYAGESVGGKEYAVFEGGVDVHATTEGAAWEFFGRDVAAELSSAANTFYFDEHAVLLQEVWRHGVRGPNLGAFVGPNCCAADVVDVAVGVDDGGGGRCWGFGFERFAHLAGAGGAHAGVDDDVAGAGVDERCGCEVVSDGDPDSVGDFQDAGRADVFSAVPADIVRRGAECGGGNKYRE